MDVVSNDKQDPFPTGADHSPKEAARSCRHRRGWGRRDIVVETQRFVRIMPPAWSRAAELIASPRRLPAPPQLAQYGRVVGSLPRERERERERASGISWKKKSCVHGVRTARPCPPFRWLLPRVFWYFLDNRFNCGICRWRRCHCISIGSYGWQSLTLHLSPAGTHLDDFQGRIPHFNG
ncbi:hypothetical protein LZ30DRAFT_368152 [Colletotrichum cereale]|nr:hypothetical protein LZ30DRAFT_368152 [Colletotrichum cereale]